MKRVARNVAFGIVLAPILLVLVGFLFLVLGVRVARRLQERADVIDAGSGES